MKTYDAIIIGFGKAGKTLAADLAAQGQRVALIEKSDHMYGGTCINIGCIPSKYLVLNSSEGLLMDHQTWDEKQNYYHQSIEQKNQLTATLRQKNYEKLIQAGVDVIHAAASFIDEKTIEIKTKDKIFSITSDRIFINTGAQSFIPPIKGVDLPHVYTSDTLMDLDKLPKTLVIVGGGYIGLEFASIYASFGSKVIVLQDLKTFLPREDKDMADEILRVLTHKGIEIHMGVQVQEFMPELAGVKIKYVDQNDKTLELKADAVLIATGRRPNIQGLNLAAAHIETTPKGAIKVDETLKTTNPHVWAMGDVTGGLQFTYVSLDDYRVIKSQVYGDKKYTVSDRKNVPYSVFITPPYSRVGLNETEAKEAGIKIKMGKLMSSSFPKSQVLREKAGMVKVIIDAKTDLILGAMLFCPESYETINLIKLAMDVQVPYQILKDNIYTHPTMSESFNDLFGTVA